MALPPQRRREAPVEDEGAVVAVVGERLPRSMARHMLSRQMEQMLLLLLPIFVVLEEDDLEHVVLHAAVVEDEAANDDETATRSRQKTALPTRIHLKTRPKTNTHRKRPPLDQDDQSKSLLPLHRLHFHPQ